MPPVPAWPGCRIAPGLSGSRRASAGSKSSSSSIRSPRNSLSALRAAGSGDAQVVFHQLAELFDRRRQARRRARLSPNSGGRMRSSRASRLDLRHSVARHRRLRPPRRSISGCGRRATPLPCRPPRTARASSRRAARRWRRTAPRCGRAAASRGSRRSRGSSRPPPSRSPCAEGCRRPCAGCVALLSGRSQWRAGVSQRPSISTICCSSNGLTRKSSMPASRQRSRTSASACAVKRHDRDARARLIACRATRRSPVRSRGCAWSRRSRP